MERDRNVKKVNDPGETRPVGLSKTVLRGFLVWQQFRFAMTIAQGSRDRGESLEASSCARGWFRNAD